MTNAKETASKTKLSNLRSNEAGMQGVYSTGWEDHNLIDKANALYQQDQAIAKQLCGRAWTQRALAKQSFDAYGSPLEMAFIDIIVARSERSKINRQQVPQRNCALQTGQCGSVSAVEQLRQI